MRPFAPPSRCFPGRLLPLGLALALGAGCSPAPEEAPAPPEALTNQALALRFAGLPQGFVVADNGARLVLVGEGTMGDGTMTVEAGEPSDFGIDPVAEANAEQERFEGLPDGVFLGVRQLVLPIGPGAWARGRFSADGRALEETRVFVVHPTENRLVTASYVYPAGEAEDSGQRVQRLFELVGEIEAADDPVQPPAP
ncbi:MAG TPA: hypothetical protein VMV46_23020 [Thermoanaerobaculia bacterium]|nr:hypothetical protein [Thermoanaerobaculia bacterium]